MDKNRRIKMRELSTTSRVTLLYKIFRINNTQHYFTAHCTRIFILPKTNDEIKKEK